MGSLQLVMQDTSKWLYNFRAIFKEQFSKEICHSGV